MSLKEIAIFVLFVLVVLSSHLVEASASDFAYEYVEGGERVVTFALVLDGFPYLLFSYGDEQVLFDVVKEKPLFDLSGEDELLRIVFQQEFYHREYSAFRAQNFELLLAERLGLDASFPCVLIDYDEVLLDTAIVSSEEYVVKKYIPRQCVEEPVDCKELANDAKKALNQLAKIDNYATPQVIVAVYCKGESAWIIPQIIAPARQIDAIVQNIQNRAYLSGQIEEMYDSKEQLQSQLSYGASHIGDYARDGYFALKEAGDFLKRTTVQVGNTAIKLANVITNLFGKDISDAIMDEPQLWSEKLADARDEVNKQITTEQLTDSRRYASTQTSDSIERLKDLQKRNQELLLDIELGLGSLWGDWYPNYWKTFIYTYNTTHIRLAAQTNDLLVQAQKEQKEYRYASAYETSLEANSTLTTALTQQNTAEKVKELNWFKLLAGGLALICLIAFRYVKKQDQMVDHR